MNYNIPCGKCPKCTARRASAWSFRLMAEDRVAASAYFITLTYDNANLPLSPGGRPTLKKRDLQLFFKTLRRLEVANPHPIKYYAVGEYGTRGYRPHYHIILFNVANTANIDLAWTVNSDPTKPRGTTFPGTVAEASVGYTLKYISKPGRIPTHKHDDRVPEFSLMSKRLGKSYLTPAILKWHHADLENRMYLNLTDGKKIAMPRYYKDRIYDEQQRKLVSTAQMAKLSSAQLDPTSSTYDLDFANQQSSIVAEYERAAYRSKQNLKL